MVLVPSGQVCGLAAVGVWDSPTRGALPADVWQPLADDPEGTTAVLEQVRALGVCLALDGVGGSGSSLAAIARLPLDIATLDSSLVLAADAGDRPLALLEAVVGLTRRLGLLTVAAGVQTRAQLELLGRLGCTAVRGPAVAGPVPAADVAALLPAGPLPD